MPVQAGKGQAGKGSKVLSFFFLKYRDERGERRDGEKAKSKSEEHLQNKILEKGKTKTNAHQLILNETPQEKLKPACSGRQVGKGGGRKRAWRNEGEKKKKGMDREVSCVAVAHAKNHVCVLCSQSKEP